MAESMHATYVWMAIYGIACLMFFSVSVWVIIRGGKDVLEMLTDPEKLGIKDTVPGSGDKG